MSFSWWTFALQAVNFLILIWLLQRFLFKPVKAIVAQRKQEISSALTAASRQTENAERLEHEIEGKRSGLDAERQKMIDGARSEILEQRQRLLEESRAQADQIKQQARNLLDEERRTASAALYQHAVSLATDLAARLLTELALPSLELPFLWQALNYIDQMTADERARLCLSAEGSDSALTVTTAHPLDVNQQAEWRERLIAKLGTKIDVRFSADPELIAGAVITFPDAVLRFNWRDSLAAAAKKLQADG